MIENYYSNLLLQQHQRFDDDKEDDDDDRHHYPHDRCNLTRLFRIERSRRFEDCLSKSPGSTEERERRRKLYTAKETEFLRWWPLIKEG